MANDKAEYIREWRKTPEGQVSLARQKDRERAKRAAVADLIVLHEIEYKTLLASHLQRIKREARGS